MVRKELPIYLIEKPNRPRCLRGRGSALPEEGPLISTFTFTVLPIDHPADLLFTFRRISAAVQNADTAEPKSAQRIVIRLAIIATTRAHYEPKTIPRTAISVVIRLSVVAGSGGQCEAAARRAN